MQNSHSLHQNSRCVTFDDQVSDWQVKLPRHWNIARLRHVAKIQLSNVDKHTFEDEESVKLCNYTDVYKKDYINSNLQFMRATASKAEIKKFKLLAGDVLITKDSESWQDIAVPAYVTEDIENTLCGYHLAQIRPNIGRLLGEFLFRAIGSEYVSQQFRVSANGVTRYAIGLNEMRSAWIPVPPVTEQKQIVRFVRNLDARVNKLIKAKRRLIELLNEQKQAIIHQAVTRGLDPTVPLMPSGIAWLGEIPVTWEVRRVKQLSTILRGKFSHRPRNEPTLYDGEYPFIQTGEVARAEKVIQGYRQTLNEKGLAVSKMFPSGTLVMTIAANIGEVAVLDFDACFPDSIVGFVPKPIVQRDFLYYVFVAMKPELLREAPVNTQGNLNVERIGCRELALPPISDQGNIVAYIEESIEDLNRTIRTAKSEINLIREYRTRLVADVVTGQFDVRQHPWANSDLDQEDSASEAVTDDLEEEMLDESESEELSE